jgi:hypothetical protein
VACFEKYIGIDYSGAQTPTSSLKGLRVYVADLASPPTEVLPPPSPRWYWTRRGLAEWLVKELSGDTPVLVGIDHAFSFPLRYFEKYGLPFDWHNFLDDFQRHWPTDDDHTYVDFIRDGSFCDLRTGDPSWFRLTEQWTAAAKSVFRFDVQGSVAKSTHAGIPWLRYIGNHCKERVHFWPFDGWNVPEGKSAIVEVYPSLWMRRYSTEGRTGDQQAAYAVAATLRRADLDGTLAQWLNPRLEEKERRVAEIEGWIFGVA